MENPQRPGALTPKLLDHPECQPDEIYMGNSSLLDLHQSNWRTKRFGTTAIDIKGNVLGSTGYPGSFRPWFIKRSEVEQAIEAERAKPDNPCGKDRIRVYEGLLNHKGLSATPEIIAGVTGPETTMNSPTASAPLTSRQSPEADRLAVLVERFALVTPRLADYMHLHVEAKDALRAYRGNSVAKGNSAEKSGG